MKRTVVYFKCILASSSRNWQNHEISNDNLSNNRRGYLPNTIHERHRCTSLSEDLSQDSDEESMENYKQYP